MTHKDEARTRGVICRCGHADQNHVIECEICDCQEFVAAPAVDRAEELAREIHARCHLWSRTNHGLGGQEQIDELAALLRSRMAEPIGYWVSTDDRLPQPNSAVLFYTTEGCWESGYFRADEDEPVRWECERTNPQDERIDFFEGQVTHWVIPDPPLPSAPDTEEKA